MTPRHILDDVESVSSHSHHILVVTKSGNVLSWGDNTSEATGQVFTGSNDYIATPTLIEGFHGVTRVAAGMRFSVALLDNGKVMTWGENYLGQLGRGWYVGTDHVPTEIITTGQVFTSIGADSLNSFAYSQTEATFYIWGENRRGQYGNGTRFMNHDHAPEKMVSPGAPFKALSGGMDFTIALLEDGSVWGTGRNEYGTLGNGNTDDSIDPWGEKYRSTFKQVDGLEDIIVIRSGFDFNFAMDKNGVLWSWGNNDHGQLGDGSSDLQNRPVKVMSF